MVALGNQWRRDDGVGSAVLELLTHLEGVATLAAVREPLDLIDLWAGADVAVVIDALSSKDDPGTVQAVELQLGSDPGAAGFSRPCVSGHGIGMVEVIRLAQQLGTAPSRAVVVGVVVEDIGHGTGLSGRVADAAPDAARLVDQVVRSIRPDAAP